MRIPFTEAWKRSYLLRATLIVIGMQVVMVVLIFYAPLELDKKVGLAASASLPLFALALLQLGRALVSQRASFVTDYISKYYTEAGLSETFNYLAATYSDDIFKQVLESAKSPDLQKLPQSMFTCLGELNDQRPEGRRFYHPDYFQGSLEEIRLDSLLGYLDVIGYHYVHGLLRMQDITGMIGYQLAVVSSREVIRHYLKESGRSWWERTGIYKDTAVQPPYTYLRILIKEFKAYNLKHYEIQKKTLEQHQRKIEGQLAKLERDKTA